MFKASLLYWIVALLPVSLILIVQGECFADTACQIRQRHVGQGLLLGAAGLYALFLRRAWRKSVKATPPALPPETR